MPLHLPPMDIRAWDEVTLAGRRETVRCAPREVGGWVYLNVVGDGGDPYVVRPDDMVLVNVRR